MIVRSGPRRPNVRSTHGPVREPLCGCSNASRRLQLHDWPRDRLRDAMHLRFVCQSRTMARINQSSQDLHIPWTSRPLKISKPRFVLQNRGLSKKTGFPQNQGFVQKPFCIQDTKILSDLQARDFSEKPGIFPQVTGKTEVYTPTQETSRVQKVRVYIYVHIYIYTWLLLSKVKMWTAIFHQFHLW